MNKIKRKVAASIMAAGIFGMVGASSASAAGPAITPVCYFKKVVNSSGIVMTTTTYNVVDQSYVVQYPARTKKCHVVQTQNIQRRFLPDIRKTVWSGWITVNY